MSPIKDVEKALPTHERNEDRHDVDFTLSNNLLPKTSRREEVEAEEIERIPTHHTSHSARHNNPVLKLAKTLTTRSNASIKDPGPPPDGGVKAWTQSLMGHMVIFNTWGMISSFGVFQQHYTADLGLEPSAVSWIGSMQMFGHFSLGMFTGRMLDIGYFYWSVVPGMLLSALGIFMTSLCTQYWQFFLSQGLLAGFGFGMQFAPTISLVGTYFSKNRTVALAIMASGSATGGLVYPTIARQLLPKIGFPWTSPTSTFAAPEKWPTYSLFLIAVFTICLGQYFAFYYIPTFATNILDLSYGTAINVLLVLNGIGILGRLVPSYFADQYFGCYNMLIPFCFASGIILFFWPLVDSSGGLYGWAITYGFFVAGFQGMFPAVLTSLTKDMSRVGTRNGMGLAIIGLGTFIGPPIAGALIQSYGGSYLVAQMFGGATILLGSVVLVIGRISVTGMKFKVRR
ncbi:MFS general substrate transporter [Ophiobolus disseminans]|uniref:MFS general substrate transporter n=1 Tax=Ophiobolus disseminans TaxID=1469910 RepID=A0A6A7A110_9PLEO|nr:MFS general substrate transporter [Ophiobolus disseminans]